jgi:tetratricopeptide (TPR) repeat protein
MRRLVTITFGVVFLVASVLLFSGCSAFAEEEKSEQDIGGVGAELLEQLRGENDELRKELTDLRRALEELRAEKGLSRETREEVAKQQEEAFKTKEQAELELRKAMDQLQLEMQQLQSQRERLTADLSQEMARKQKAVEDLDAKVADQEYQKALNLETGMGVAQVFRALSKAPPAAASEARAAYDAAIAEYQVGAKQRELEDAMLSKGDAGLIAILRFEKVKLFRKLRMYDPAVQELRRIIEQNLDERVTEAARWTLVETLQEQKEKEAAIAELEKILTTTGDARKKKDALYGIINLLGDDPESKVRAIEQLIRQLQGKQPGVAVSEELPVSLLRAIQPGIPGPTEPIRPVQSVPAASSRVMSLPGEKAPAAPAVELPAAGAPPRQPEPIAPVGQPRPLL